VDVAGGEEREGDHVDGDAVLVAEFLELVEVVGGPVASVGGEVRVADDVLDAVPLEVAEHLRAGRPALAADVHPDGLAFGGPPGGGAGGGQGGGPGGGEEVAALHERSPGKEAVGRPGRRAVAYSPGPSTT